MAPKKTKWIIGLSSVAAFTGFIGFLNGITSTESSQHTAYNQSGSNGQQSEIPSSENPFAQEDPSNSSSDSYTIPDGGSSGSSDSWTGDYQGDSSTDSTNESSGGSTTDFNSGLNNFSSESGFQAPPSDGSTTESGDLRSQSS